jgi:hypothetical protein
MLFGGVDADNNGYNDLWEFNVDTFEWTLLSNRDPAAPSPRGHQTMTLMGNEVHIIGGKQPVKVTKDDDFKISGPLSSTPANELFVYMIDQKRWKEMVSPKDLISPRYMHSATAVGKNIFVFGGLSTEVSYNTKRSRVYWRLFYLLSICF